MFGCSGSHTSNGRFPPPGPLVPSRLISSPTSSQSSPSLGLFMHLCLLHLTETPGLCEFQSIFIPLIFSLLRSFLQTSSHSLGNYSHSLPDSSTGWSFCLLGRCFNPNRSHQESFIRAKGGGACIGNILSFSSTAILSCDELSAAIRLSSGIHQHFLFGLYRMNAL